MSVLITDPFGPEAGNLQDKESQSTGSFKDAFVNDHSDFYFATFKIFYN